MAGNTGRSSGKGGRDGAQPYAVRSLERGLSVLTCFDVEHPRLSLAELTRTTGLHKATCFRLVKTLEASGFLKADDASGEYSLGMALVRVAYLVRSADVVVSTARPYLESLNAATGESVDLTVWTPDGPVLVDRCLTKRAFQPRNTPGSVIADRCTTHARIWLATGTSFQRTRARELFGLPADSSEGEATLEAADRRLLDEMQPVLDVAADRGVCAIGLPIRDASSKVVASLSLVSPYPPPDAATMDARIRVLRAAASDISRALGHHPDGSGQRQA